ncbi:MAG: type VII secretion protein EssC [Clostridiales bacterium]|jgi:S-DNA-T family DNA segregation ATPase FtsK/SpoIIIE|nr:type VII secretion protein EssC [Clostridiales bacterium]
MKLTLFSENDYTSITLPERYAGHYWLRGKDGGDQGNRADIVAVEASRSLESGGVSEWRVKSNRRFSVVDKDNNELLSAVLNPMELYRVQSKDRKVKYILYTEPLSADRLRYGIYRLRAAKTVLSIGRETANNICYGNKFVSAAHAELALSNNGAAVRDLDSRNRTYVNGVAVKQRRLHAGDVVYILGMQIIVAGDLIFVNNPDGNVRIQSADLAEYRPPSATADPEPDNDEELDFSEDYFYRAPRFKHGVDEYELKLDPPTAKQGSDDVPMIMLIGPSLTMGMASIASGTFAVSSALQRGDITQALPSVVMCFSMLLGTVMWPVITKSFQRRLRVRKEAKRQEMYHKYLEQVRGLIEIETAEQERIMRANDVAAAAYLDRILAPTPLIWERTPKHKDFLSLRLGYGDLPLKANITYPHRQFTVEPDNLTEEMYALGEEEHILSDVPVCLPLVERYISGIYSLSPNRRELFAYAKSLILQIVALHSYDEVKLVMIYDEKDSEEFAFARWLPHTMSDDKTVRYIATNSDEAKALSFSLDRIIEDRKDLTESKLEDEKPYYVIICLDKDLASKAECVRRVAEHKENLKFSVLSLFGRLKDLPKECSAVAELRGRPGDGSVSSLTYISDVSDPSIAFIADNPESLDMDRATKVLANTFIDINGSNFALPPKYSFFEMLEIGMIEHLNLPENWSNNNPAKSLAVVVGVDKYGEPFKLDLHEKAHGPHGLVAGMTGSGKSEFITAYILSLAVSFHPREVAFILIDYKGGGMAKAFENIPHTAGVITNLDGNGIKRSLASMRSELHRRETIFRDTAQQHGIGSIDIYKYQKLYRDGKVKVPLPHLFIISDEFAELKKEQPDFMTELTSASRVGRSLGVHLILATQKPGGVVDDQVRSNSRFKVCLKVQDSGDSMEMLERPDAAALVNPGRFYLQVGYNELFEIGQSAWAGAPYYPSSKVIKDRDDSLTVINTNGKVIAEANTDRFAMIKDPKKQLDVMTSYIEKVSREEGISRWKMWLDPLPDLIYSDEITEKYGELRGKPFVLNPVAGEYDDPTRQAQGLLRVPITQEGNVIVYGSSGSGKAMFVEALCYSLIKEHSPKEVNIYILDFDAETLTAFSEAPHVGDVILSYEKEKVGNLFKLALGKLETRKKLLSRAGGSLAEYNKSAEKPEPAMLIIINNYAAFNELYEEKAAELSYLTREGTKYGIFFILTCIGVNNVRFALLQNFKQLFCLRLNNPDDYSSVVGKTGGMQPEGFKGRGLFRRDKDSLLEFQTSCLSADESSYTFIQKFSKEVLGKYGALNETAVKVPVIREKVDGQFLKDYITKDDFSKVPVGMEKSTLDIAYYDFTKNPVNLVLSSGQEWQGFMGSLSAFIADNYDVKTIMLTPQGGSGLEELVKSAHEVYDLALARNNGYKDKMNAGEAPPVFEDVFVMIQSMAALKTALERYRPPEDEKKEADDDTPFNRLQTAMDKCVKEYNIHFVVGDAVNALNPFTAEEWYRTHFNPMSGIWAGSGINNQYRLTVNKRTADYQAETSPGYGFVITEGSAALVKLID